MPEIRSLNALELVEKYGDMLYRFCRSVAKSRDAADDLYQDTFVRAFSQISKITLADKPQAILFGMAISEWKNRQSKFARRRRIAPESSIDEYDVVESQQNIEDDYISAEERRIVRMIVDGLPDKHRIPIVMFYVGELGIEEISATLKIPSGTVKSRLHSARGTIKKGLIENGIFR